MSSSPPCRRPSPQSNSQLRPRLASRGRRTASTGTSTHGATTRSRGWQRSGLGASGCLPPATRRDDCDGRPPRATTRRSWPPQRRRQKEASTCDHRPGTFKRGLCGRPLHAQKAASRLRQLGGDARASNSAAGRWRASAHARCRARAPPSIGHRARAQRAALSRGGRGAPAARTHGSRTSPLLTPHSIPRRFATASRRRVESAHQRGNVAVRGSCDASRAVTLRCSTFGK